MSVIAQDDKAAIKAETEAVWTQHHAPLHPTLTLETAMQNPIFSQILRAHALLNIKHKMGIAHGAAH